MYSSNYFKFKHASSSLRLGDSVSRMTNHVERGPLGAQENPAGTGTRAAVFAHVYDLPTANACTDVAFVHRVK